MKSHPIKIAKCLYCHQAYPTRNTQKRYCSKGCQEKARWQRDKKARPVQIELIVEEKPKMEIKQRPTHHRYCPRCNQTRKHYNFGDYGSEDKYKCVNCGYVHISREAARRLQPAPSWR